MKTLFNQKETSNPSHLYGNLAPLYDFVYERNYNYNEQLQAVKSFSTELDETVLEGACGTGRLLQLLDSEFNEVVGFDKNKGMLSIAKNRVGVPLTLQGFTTFTFNKKFDVIAVLGNSITHILTDKKMKQFMEQSYSHLSPGGTLIFDYMRPPLVDGKTQTKVFENEDYSVTRRMISVLETQKTGRFNFAFEITDKNTDETITTGDSVLTRAYEPTTLIQIGENVGLKPSTETWDSKFDESRSVEDDLFVAKKESTS